MIRHARGLRLRRSGMTLMELVVAVTILAIMAGVGGAAFAQLIDRQETIRTASAEVERAVALRETLRQWILQGEIMQQRAAVPRGGRGGGGAVGRQLATVAPGQRGVGGSTGAVATGVTSAASTGRELTVLTNAPNPLMTQNVRIRIFVDADANTPEQGLTIEYQGGQGGAQTPLLRRQLDPAVGDLVIEFFDQRTGRWYDVTQAASLQAIAIRISMVPAEDSTLPRLLELPLTIVYGEITP